MKIELKWGLIIVLAGFVWICGEYVLGLHDRHIEVQGMITSFWIPFATLLVFLALRQKKRSLHGRLDYWSGVRSGAIITATVGTLTPLTLWLFFACVNPGFFDAMIAYSVASGVTPADAAAYFNVRAYLVQGVLGAVVGTLGATFVLMLLLRSRS